MKAEELMQKARQAVASARALHGLPDMDGACNRAYYAMFDAARAALMRSGAPVGAEVARTHSGLITAFGLHLVKTGRLPIALGRAINRAEELRLMPRPKALEKALVQSAQQAQRLADAFGLKVPMAPGKTRSPASALAQSGNSRPLAMTQRVT